MADGIRLRSPVAVALASRGPMDTPTVYLRGTPRGRVPYPEHIVLEARYAQASLTAGDHRASDIYFTPQQVSKLGSPVCVCVCAIYL